MKRIYFIFIVLLMILGVVGCNDNNLESKEIAELEGEIKVLKDKISKQEDIIKNLSDSGKKIDVKEYLEVLEEPIVFDKEDPMGRYYYSRVESLDANYLIEDKLRSYERIVEYLRSFEKLTEKTKKQLSKSEMKEIGNLDGETQTLGFANIPLSVVGGLYDQNLIIKKLDFELAIEKYEDGDIKLEVLEEKKAHYIKAKKDYERFIETAAYAD